MSQRIPLIITHNKKLSKIFIGISQKLSRLFPNLKFDIKNSALGYSETEYIAISILNSVIYSLFFLLLFFVLLYSIQKNPLEISFGKSAIIASGIFLMFMAVLIAYPKVLSGKRAEQIDKNLIFALKDMMMQISSGVSIYNSMANISKAGYGQVSEEFEKAAKNILSGMSVEKSLQSLALESSSEFLRRTIWQLINTIKVGASLKGALKGIIDELTIEQKDKIRTYSRELNMWVLAYMMFAVAVPTIGATILVILTGFAGYSITKGIFISFIAINLVIQYILIGFIKYRRPIVNM